MKALLAACKPLILLDFHRSFNDTPTKNEYLYGLQVLIFLFHSEPAAFWCRQSHKIRCSMAHRGAQGERPVRHTFRFCLSGQAKYHE